MARTAIVKASELGVNCWLAARFTGGICDRALTCKYPERVKCRAWPKGVKGEVLESQDLERISPYDEQ